jgi:tetratricopeptide (TPR) repeat protein
MKRYVALILASLFAASSPLRAQSLDDQYVRIFGLIQEADQLGSSQASQALAKYVEAQAALQRLQKGSPDWNASVIKFRLNYVAEKIAALTPSAATNQPTVAAAAPAEPGKPALAPEIQTQLATLDQQVRQLQAEKVVLETKLKEALSMQPAESDPRELARAEEKIKTLQKENDLLRTSLETAKAKTTAAAATPPAVEPRPAPATELSPELGKKDLKRLKQLENERDALQQQLLTAQKALKKSRGANTASDDSLALVDARARLAVYEARQVPYTKEELALLNVPEPKQPDATPAPKSPSKSVRELSPKAAKLVVEARQYHQQREFDKAEAAYVEALREEPKSVAILANLAIVQIDAGHLDAADQSIRQALELEPNNAYSLSVLGRVRFTQEKYDAALEALSRAASLEPNNAEVQNFLGLTLVNKGLRAPAETALRKAVELEPNYPNAHYNLAVLYLNGKPAFPALARWHYQKARASGYPRNPAIEQKLEGKN